MRPSALALALITLIALPTVCCAQSTLSFARVMSPADFSTTGFSIVNPQSTAATVTFNLYGLRGGPTQTSSQTIPPRGQVARLASELFPGVSGAGWVEATSNTAGLQGFWLAGDFSTFADSAEAATPSNELVLPLVAPDSEVNVANTSDSDVTVVLHLLGQDGADLSQAFPQRIPARGFFKADVAPLFAPIDDFSLATHMRVECRCAGASYIATVIARNYIAGPSWAVLNGLPASTPTTTLNFPHLVDGPQGAASWKSVIDVTNLSATTSNDIIISFVSESGTLLRSASRSLPPNGSVRGNSRDFFSPLLPADFQNGWLRVTSTNGVPLTGYVAYAETRSGGVAVVPPQQEAQTALLFSHIADLPPWFTGLALLNANPSATANVEIFALNPNGTLIGKAALSLPSGAKTAKLLSELIGQTQSRASDGGFLFVRSDIPLYGIELFFSRSLLILSNVAAGRVLPGIQFVPPTQ